eukprot:403354405
MNVHIPIIQSRVQTGQSNMVVLHSKFDQTHYPEITNKGSSQNSKQLTIFESYVYNEPLLKESTTIQAEQIDKKIVKQRAISNQPS